MRIAIGADHAGFELKEQLRRHLEHAGHKVDDLGAHAYDKGDDYPHFARKVAEAVAAGLADRGIVVCDTGIGVDIAANKVPGARSALVHDVDLARRTREHNDTNVLSLGAICVDADKASTIADVWLATGFSGEERHARRIAQIREMESDTDGTSDA